MPIWKSWILQEQNAEFVACIEDVLEIYAQAYDPKCPVICMDEQPVQWIKDQAGKNVRFLSRPWFIALRLVSNA